MDNDDIERMLNLHPLTVFSKLASENPTSKLYQKCLQNEIDTAAETLGDNLRDEQLMFLEHLIDNLPEHRIRSDTKEGRDIAIKVNVIKRIFAAVRKLREKRSRGW